jgi:RNA polymerase sigma factor (sigma-70 family)
MEVVPNTHRLLERLRKHADDAEAWLRLDALYRPLLHTWLRKYALQPQDADDLVQQVFEVLVRKLAQYDSRKGSFRGWLRGILRNRLREFLRSQKTRPLASGNLDASIVEEVPNHRHDPRRLHEREHAKHVTQRLLARVRPDFSASSWQAFERLVEGENPAAVAADLGISVNAAYLAKSSILRRLRHESETLSN